MSKHKNWSRLRSPSSASSLTSQRGRVSTVSQGGHSVEGEQPCCPAAWGPHQRALSWVHAAALPTGSAPKREAQRGVCGGGVFLEAKSYCLQAGNTNLRQTIMRYLRNTDCGIGREYVAQHCPFQKVNLWGKQGGHLPRTLTLRASLVVGLTQWIGPLFLTEVCHLKWKSICFQMVRISHSTGLPAKARLGNAGEPDRTLTNPQGAMKAWKICFSALSYRYFPHICRINNSK